MPFRKVCTATKTAVPLLENKGRVVETLACDAPSGRMDIEVALGHLPVMHQAAELLLAEGSE